MDTEASVGADGTVTVRTEFSAGAEVLVSIKQPSTLKAPPNTALPVFVYGMFKPGELGFERLREMLLAGSPTPARVAGRLWIRDGLPLLECTGTAGEVRGVPSSLLSRAHTRCVQSHLRD